MSAMDQRPGFIGGEPIELHRFYGTTLVAEWRHGGGHPADGTHLRIGRLPDGRWFVQHTNMPYVEYAFATEQDAELAVVELRMMRDETGWTRTR